MRKLSPTPHALMLIPQRGGQERTLGEIERIEGEVPMPYLAWTPDSKGLVLPWREPGKAAGLHLISVDTEERRRLTEGGGDSGPAFSPDGSKIAFSSDRSGAWEIWVCNGDGSKPVQLTFLGAPDIFCPAWSPDGRYIAFGASPEGKSHIFIISASGGFPRRLKMDPAFDKHPFWSHDGQSLYFASNRSGSDQIWKMPAAGGEATQITRNTGDRPMESPDGKSIYYLKGWPLDCSVWRIPVDGGEETKILDSVHYYGHWTVWQRGIYFFASPDKQGRSDFLFYEFATEKTSKIMTVERRVGANISASTDGRRILYTQFDQSGSDLMLVENFR